MKKKLQFMFTALAAVAFGTSASAQCPSGQVPVTVDVTTDTWGYECYWELTPQGDACGTNTISAFGNTLVGCGGEGAQVATSADPGAYASSTTITENLGCIVIGTCFTIHYVDDYGDDGASFTVNSDGSVVTTFSTTGSYDFCATGQVDYDLALTGASNGSYYAMIPNEHAPATTLSFSADVENLGALDLTGVAVTAVVNDGTSDVHTATSTPMTLATTVANNVALTPDFTLPSVIAAYSVTYTGASTEVDQNTGNETLTSAFNVTDSVLSRAATTLTGALGIGAALESGKLGQTFATSTDDAITSISGFHNSPTPGDSTRYGIWDLVGGQPGSEIVVTDVYVFTTADSANGNGVMVTLDLPAPLSITAGTEYVVMAYEYNNNVSLGTDADNYEMGTNWVTWDSNPNGAGVWSNGEAFGFSVDYALYVNFGDIVGVSENVLSDINVYPNPSKDFVNVQLTEDVNNATVVVYAMDGSIVSTKVVTGSLFTVDVQDFANGIYMVEIRDNNNTGVVKIIKE